MLVTAVRTGVLASPRLSLILGAPHGDERAGEIKTRLKERVCAPNEVRTRVSALRGPRPGPLDNGGRKRRNFTISPWLSQLQALDVADSWAINYPRAFDRWVVCLLKQRTW